MKKQFSEEVFDNLNENKAFPLSILLEEDEATDLEDEAKDLFDMSDGDVQASKDPDSKKESPDETPQGDGTQAPQGDGIPQEDTELRNKIEDLKMKDKDFKKLKNDIDKVLTSLSGASNDDVQGVQNYMANALQTESKDLSFYNKNSIAMFLLEKNDNIEQVESSLENLDALLSKGSEIIDKFKKGKSIDINRYVDVAINAFRNFDNLFSKEKIVKQAAINMIILNSGAKAEENIKKFEKLFHEELHKQFGIEYDDHVLDSQEMNVAVGARSQS